MTTSDIIRIVSTVAVSQLVCDWLANSFFFSKEIYQRSVGNYERAQWKLRRAKKEVEDAAAAATTTRTTTSAQPPSSQDNKHAKKFQRANEDCKEAAADVAQKHTFPQIFISIFFLMLLRIFGTEYGGKAIAVLPFAPIALLQRVTGRGLDLTLASSFASMNKGLPEHLHKRIPQLVDIAASSGNKVTDVTQACSFLLIYILASFSVKYYVHKLFGTEPPAGADQGIGTMMESPQVEQMARRLGLEADPKVGAVTNSSSGSSGKSKSTALQLQAGKKSKKHK